MFFQSYFDFPFLALKIDFVKILKIWFKKPLVHLFFSCQHTKADNGKQQKVSIRAFFDGVLDCLYINEPAEEENYVASTD